MARVGFKIIKDCIKTKRHLKNLQNRHYVNEIIKCGVLGVQALAANTPRDTGKTAASWTFEAIEKNGSVSLAWYNTNVISNGTPLVIMLQYGHGTGTGGYVVGRDFINPAMKPVFEEIKSRVGEAVRFK